MNIVVIDDEADVAGVLAASLAEQGHVALPATNAADAMRLIQEKEPDAVFLDIMMPGVDGVEILRRLRRDWPGLPVIVITGFAHSPKAQECRRLGVVDVVEKPEFLAGLGEALAKLRSARN